MLPVFEPLKSTPKVPKKDPKSGKKGQKSDPKIGVPRTSGQKALCPLNLRL